LFVGGTAGSPTKVSQLVEAALDLSLEVLDLLPVRISLDALPVALARSFIRARCLSVGSVASHDWSPS
jgi:hypothetical protein